MTNQVVGTKTRTWLPHIKTVIKQLNDDEMALNLGIHVIPDKFRSSVNDDALCPRIVSIGHFFSGTPGYLEMHEQKLIYLSFLLRRTGDAEKALDECCSAISESEEFNFYARNFGSEAIPPEKMMEIMVVDGCFILELLLGFSNPDMVYPSDIVLKYDWFTPSLPHDLLLLENQLPMFVLDVLVKTIKRVSRKVRKDQPVGSGSGPGSVFLDLDRPLLRDLIAKFLESSIREIIHPQDGTHDRITTGNHFLDTMHMAFFYKPPKNDHDHDQVAVQIGPDGKTPELNRGAMGLFYAGVKIEAAENRHLLDLSFSDKTLKIPPLRVDMNTWSVLKNLVVLEQCNMERSHHVTSYAVVLRSLIRTRRDVDLLVQRGVLKVDLPTRYEVLDFVECVWSNAVLPVVKTDFTYQKLFSDLNGHHDPWRPWHERRVAWILGWDKNKRVLRRDYFPNPWRIIQLIVAFLLLVFTGLQTVYTVMGNYK